MNRFRRFFEHMRIAVRQLVDAPIPATLPAYDEDCPACQVRSMKALEHRPDCIWLKATDTW